MQAGFAKGVGIGGRNPGLLPCEEVTVGGIEEVT